MKLLGTYTSVIDANHVANTLREKGVLCRVSDINTYNYWAITGVTDVRVWVILDAQWEDAQALLADSSHIPEHPLPLEDIALLEESQPLHFQRIIYALGGLVVVIVLALVFLFSQSR